MQYEYRTFTADRLPSAEQLTELGGEGWLLATIMPSQRGGYVLFLTRQSKTSREQDILEALRQIQEMGKDIKP